MGRRRAPTAAAARRRRARARRRRGGRAAHQRQAMLARISTKAISSTATTAAATIRSAHSSAGLRRAATVAPARARAADAVRRGPGIASSRGAPGSSSAAACPFEAKRLSSRDLSACNDADARVARSGRSAREPFSAATPASGSPGPAASSSVPAGGAPASSAVGGADGRRQRLRLLGGRRWLRGGTPRRARRRRRQLGALDQLGGQARDRHALGAELLLQRPHFGAMAVARLLRFRGRLRERLAQVVDLGPSAVALVAQALELHARPIELAVQALDLLCELGALALKALHLGGALGARRVALAGEPLELGRKLLLALDLDRRSARVGDVDVVFLGLGAQLHVLPLASGQLGAQPLDLAAQGVDLGAQRLVARIHGRAPAPAPAAVGQRQVDDDAAAHLELRAGDLGGIAGPVERGAPALLGGGRVSPGHRDEVLAAATLGLDGQHRAAQAPSGQPLPPPCDLQALIGPLEAFELEGDLAHGHQSCFSSAAPFPPRRRGSTGAVGAVSPAAAAAAGSGSGSGVRPRANSRRRSGSAGATGSWLSVVWSRGPRASTADTCRRGSRRSTVSARRTRPNVSSAPRDITSVAPSASQAPVSGSCPAAAGGGSMICDATIAATARTAAGRKRRSTRSTSCVVSPSPAAIDPSASTNSTTSQTSNASHAAISPSNHARNRLTRRSRAPSVTSSGPASSLRVIDPPSVRIPRTHLSRSGRAPNPRPALQATEMAARWRSTTRAQRRPSAIALTTSDWPMRASPAANTPGRELAYAGAFTFPRRSSFSPSSATAPACSGCEKPIAIRTRSAGSSNSVPGTGRGPGGGVTYVPWTATTWPSRPSTCVAVWVQRRSPPSSSAYVLTSRRGACGHGTLSRAAGPGGAG